MVVAGAAEGTGELFHRDRAAGLKDEKVLEISCTAV